jgi:indole-3-glycerol phosphate synthase
MILERIVAQKRQTLEQAKAAHPLAELRRQARQAPTPNGFAQALRAPGVALIAEVKRASPSRGLLCPDFDPVRLATIYARHGAAAISVLTDEPFFQGHLRYLATIRNSLGVECPPLLRKDFIVDPYQLLEARAYGADAALLIVAILTDGELRGLLREAAELGLAALVEVHNGVELARALSAGAQIVGINNRDLRDFTVNLATTERLRTAIPAGVIIVSESGIHAPVDVRRLARCGVDAMLVGESLVTAADVAAQVTALVAAGRAALSAALASGAERVCDGSSH